MQISDATAAFAAALCERDDLAPNSVTAYSADVEAFSRFLGPHFQVEEITASDVSRFVEMLVCSSLKRSSARRRLAGVRRFCRWLETEGLLAFNPATAHRIKPSRQRPLPQALSAAEASTLLQWTEAESRGRSALNAASGTSSAVTHLLVAILLATGVRVSELCEADVAAVSSADGSFRVTGKGRRERTVYLPDAICSRLIAYIDSRAASPAEPLLLNRVDARLSARAACERVTSSARLAGIERRVTPHMLRHTSATLHLERGTDIRIVQRLLGHANISTTEIYTHVSDSALRRAVEAASVVDRLMEPQ